MRTTVTLEPDVAEQLRQIMKERNLTFKEAVNSTLRRGLGREVRARPYRAPSHAMGLKPGIDGDRLVHVMDEMADEEFIKKMRGTR
ncbi:MAG: hypothetical protein U9R47_03810 [Actinomycetota bacterium]|nr:hypothetical protein [Actinomycetota bacterium]